MFQPWSPGYLTIDFFEDGNNTRGDQLPLRFVFGLKNIEGVNIFGVSGVKVATIVDAGGGNVVKNSVAKITVGVDDGHTFAFANIINGHVGNESGFTGTGFSNNIGVAAAVFAIFDTKNSFFVFELGFGENSNALTLLFG